MTEIKYVCCFNCGHARVLKNFRLGAFPIDPAEFYILRVRRQASGGYESKEKPGFYDLPEKAKTMTDLWNSDDEEERLLAVTLKDRLLSVVQAYMREGIITRQELEE